MKDVFGNELAEGDVVAFMEPGYTYALKKGTIVRFTPKKLVIAWVDPQYTSNVKNMETYKFPEQVVKKVVL